MADRVFWFFLPESETLSLPAGPRCKDLAYRIGDGKHDKGRLFSICQTFNHYSEKQGRTGRALEPRGHPHAVHVYTVVYGLRAC